MKVITVAIDGPAASGKSTTARTVAERLGYCHLNSGLLYRAVTWAAMIQGWIDDPCRFDSGVGDLRLALQRDPPVYRVLLGGREVGPELSSPGTASRVSEVAAAPIVRAKVLDLLRAEGARGGIVCDGRDIGTEVFPNAELKIFLLASPEERARRRLLDMGMEPTPLRVRQEAETLRARDEADSTRLLAPLRKAADAIELNTTHMEPWQVVDRIVDLALAAGASIG